MKNVEIRTDLSPEAFDRDYVRACRPVLLRGLVQDWPAVGNWTPDGLGKVAGDLIVPLRRTPEKTPELAVSKVHQGHVPLRDALQQMTEHPDRETYVPGFKLRQSPELLAQTTRPAILDQYTIDNTSVFTGTHTRCLGHMHPRVQALLCHVEGTKKVVLYSPDQLAKLYMHPTWSTGFFQSKVNFDDIDAERFPMLEEATPMVAELQPGDALFIPVHWLHTPTGSAYSASATYWWRARMSDTTSFRAAARSAVGMAAMGARMVRTQVRQRIRS